MVLRTAPLKSSFMLAAIVGFLISVIYIPKYSLNWAFAFGLIFLVMTVAVLVSLKQIKPTYKKKKK